MINNDKIFATEMNVYACSQGLFGPDEGVETVGDFQLGDCNNGHEDPDLDKAEESSEGIIGAAAVGIAKIGGVLVTGIFKACGWMISIISSCPWIMVCIFVVLAVSGIITFAIKKSNEADEDGEIKKTRFLDKIKFISSNRTVKIEYGNMCKDNYNNYISTVSNIEKHKSEIEKTLTQYKCGGVKIKYWKDENKFNNQLKKGMIQMMKVDKGTKDLSKYPIINSSFIQIDIQKANPKDTKFCEYLESLAKKLSSDHLTLKVNKSKTGLVSEAFIMSFSQKFIDTVKRYGK